MSTFTLMRLYLRYQSMPRLPIPSIGYAGILYSSPLVDRQRHHLMEECGRTTSSPELSGTSNIVSKKGAVGSYFYRRGYSTSTQDIAKAEKARQEKSKFKQRTEETLKVMVVTDTGSLSVMTAEEANKFAKKKNMNLVPVTDPKERPVLTEKKVYKLVSKLADLDEEDEPSSDSSRVSSKKQKEVKTVLMKSSIGEHDANAKINVMKKWIKKGHRIRVNISQVGDKGNSETLFKNIETQMSEVEGQIQQKTTKGNELRFYVGPPTQTKPQKLNPGRKAKEEETDKDSSGDESGDEEETKSKRKAGRS